MRILDLGAHDGFVTNWLGRQLRDAGVEPHIDGIELHPEGVRVANERAAADGLAGEYKIGLAEDAPDLFEPGTYDAVVAYELIEHVPEVDRFLTILESMCKPGGRVYLSTPNGTFGAGQNPHHLRVYRVIDLYDLCRRRGEVFDLLPGMDGVGVVAYTPAVAGPTITITGEMPGVAPPIKALTAVVHTGGGWEAWHPDDIETRGLGGSETAAVHLASALYDLGYVVTVYGEFENPVMHGQVLYRHHSTYDPLTPTDLTVVSRQPHLFDRPINSTRKVLWMHDTDYGDLLTEERANRMDAIMVLSDWHRQHVLARYPFLAETNLVVTTRNGIDPARFPLDQIPATKDRPHRAIFSSSPDRGLDILLRLWPKVREQVPDAELVYCYGAVYDAVASQRPDLKKFRDELNELSQQDGVTNLGPLNQFALAGAMSKCRVWLAPSWHTPAGAWHGGSFEQDTAFQIGVPFFETYCIGALESAAAGCRRIMSGWGALVERCDEDPTYSVTIDPVINTSGQIVGVDEDAWVAEIVRYLKYDSMAPPSPHAFSQTWTGVAIEIANRLVIEMATG